MKKNIAEQAFSVFLKKRGLKNSAKRVTILQTFFRSGEHLTVDEIQSRVNKIDESIGAATVYRTMKLLAESGICRGFKLEDGLMRYEITAGKSHHDHLICVECGRVIEVHEPEIEKLQLRLIRKHHFQELRHRLEIYGICEKCSNHIKPGSLK